MRRHARIAFIAAGIVLAGAVWQFSGGGEDKPAPKDKQGQAKEAGPKVMETLPIKQVVLFNSGVGYFQREGEIDGTTRVPLAFPSGEIDDLLKSLVLEDKGGRVNSVNYDSHDPLDKILRSFALDLNHNPTFAQILNQARGEKIEALRLEPKETKPAKVAGTIVGIESRQTAATGSVVAAEFLNLDGPQGFQSIPLAQIVGVRFLNPVLEGEFRRALQVLASSHDTQKKSVSLGFSGEGKRQVKVGYVVERPIWKTSYRLRVDGKGKLFLQGWGLVENTSDDDWNDVRLVLVSGRPISYRMNLYEPLYIPRPTVEPDLFASLRPPVYGGDLSDDMKNALGNVGQAQPSTDGAPFNALLGGGLNNMGGIGAIGGMPLGNMGQVPPLPPPEGRGWGNMGAPIAGFMGGGMMGMGGMQLGGMNMGMNFGGMSMMGGNFTGGSFTGVPGHGWNMYQGNRHQAGALAQNRLTYDELQKRRQLLREERQKAGKIGSSVAGLNFKEGIASVASAEDVGNYFQYVVDQKVSLPRQKSAMLPILNQAIDGAKVSIFNESVHARHPLLGVRLKNTSDMPLTQGPVTVFEDGAYAGDTRLLDVQPGESRLLSFALDQGTEVATEEKTTQNPEVAVKISETHFTANYKIRQTKSYIIKNRSPHDRVMILEHPLRSGWQLVTPSKPNERTRDRYRFQVSAPSGKAVRFEVVEEQEQVEQIAQQATGRFQFAKGLEIEPLRRVIPGERIELRIIDQVLRARHVARESVTYMIRNQSGVERIFEIEHVVRPGWRLVGDKQGLEDPKSIRFKLIVPTGKTASHEVAEERLRVEMFTALTIAGAPPKFAIALGLEVVPTATLAPEQLTGLKIVKGVLKADYKVRSTHKYLIKNNADKDRVFAVEHTIQPEWKRVGADDETQAGPAVYRFELSAAAGKTASKQFVEERAFTDKDRPLKGAEPQLLRDYLSKRVLSAQVHKALSKVLDLSAQRAEADRKLAETGQQLRALGEDQSRLRANLAIIPQSAEPYKKFLGKLVSQEEQIEALQRQSRQVQESVQRLTKEYESYIADLNEE